MTTLIDARELLGGDVHSSVVRTILDANPDMDPGVAERITGQAVGFVVACAQNPDEPMAPSRVVDEGWHALLLHSFAYTELCGRFGNFVHHFPGYDPTHYDPQILDRTRGLMEKAGAAVEADLWRGPDDELVDVTAKCQHAPDCAIRPMPKPEWP
ncbi:glycine-rich domain-containing protein [Streptomyces sp. NBC_00648]|uniref:glycine-rich domain-containing protein n=1 Tax=Streptomyces sp. NBC_00648 TaxID=2975797 RepID=UPI00324AEBD4